METKNEPVKQNRVAENLRDLMIAELKDMYWAEKQLITAIPKLAEKASSQFLKTALMKHDNGTKNHVLMLERLLIELENKTEATRCDTMAAILADAEKILDETTLGAVRDAEIIVAAQKLGHYQIATYGILAKFARIIGDYQAHTILEKILTEEKAAEAEVSRLSIDIDIAADVETEWVFAPSSGLSMP